MELVAYLVPKSDISSTIIDDGPQFAVLLEIVHESLQSVDTVDEVDNSLFVVLLVQSLPDIVDGFTENGRESDTHGSLDVSVFVINDGSMNLHERRSTHGILGLWVSRGRIYGRRSVHAGQGGWSALSAMFLSTRRL